MIQQPLVTIMIATKDRHADLAVTLEIMRRQDYQNLEIIIIDDGSTPPIGPIVTQVWPEARLIRHESNRGQSARRNEGFRAAKGKYILQLDDDCSLPAEDGISMSVAYMEDTPGCSGIAYHQFHGSELPAEAATYRPPGNCVTFSGSGAFLRRTALEQTAGYRECFVGYAEEGELSLQLLKRGGTLSFRPEIVALHRCSAMNRDGFNAWKRSLRNSLWTILIHFPVSRIPMEAGWKVAVGAWDAFRLRRGRLYYEALLETVKGLSRIWSVRDPLDRLSLRRYDALRTYGVLPYAMFEDPPAPDWTSVKRWASLWANRLGESSFFSKKEFPAQINHQFIRGKSVAVDPAKSQSFDSTQMRQDRKRK